jgi:hypothetical protein
VAWLPGANRTVSPGPTVKRRPSEKTMQSKEPSMAVIQNGTRVSRFEAKSIGTRVSARRDKAPGAFVNTADRNQVAISGGVHVTCLGNGMTGMSSYICRKILISQSVN